MKVVCEGSLVDFNLRYAQELVLRAIEKQQSEGKPVRIIILKARREGISTLIGALIYHRVSMRRHRVGMVIAHDLDSAKEIFEMTRRFYTDFKRLTLRPMLRSMDRRNMIFDNPDPQSPNRGLDSKVIVETAMDIGAGVGMEINYLHMSEVSRYRDAQNLTKGLLQCVNLKDPETIVVKESTGMGMGGYFYDEVQRAKNHESDYALVFLPWFIFPNYSIEPPIDWKAKDREEKVERKYQWEGKKYILSKAQLYWREKKIENDHGGDEIGFFEQYPGSIEEAFQFSGRTRFNQNRLTEIQSKAKPYIFKGFIHEEEIKKGWKHTLEENERGYLTIFEHVKPNERYVLFADISEGKEVAERKSDYSSIDVLRCGEKAEQVAHWHGRIGPELLDDEIVKLGRYYNNAFVGIEKNSIGYGVVAAVKEVYHNMYMREVHDKVGKTITKEYGWLTTGGKKSGTKGLMIKDLAEAINDGLIQINHLGTIEELRRFAIHPDGTLAAAAGGFDDRVISISGALQMHYNDYRDLSKKGSPIMTEEEEDDYYYRSKYRKLEEEDD